MSYGSNAEAYLRLLQEEKEKRTKSSGEAKTVFLTNEFPISHTGTRIVRLLPKKPWEYDKNGHFILSDYVVFADFWLTVFDSKSNKGAGGYRKQRVFVDAVHRFDNAYSERVKAAGKATKDRYPAVKFAMNVYNRSPAIITESGEIVYEDQHNKFITKDGTILNSEDAKPLNRIQAMTGSFSESTKSVFGKVDSCIKNTMVYDEELDKDVPADATSYDISIKSTLPVGAPAVETDRSATPRPARKLPEQDKIFLLPRPDLTYFNGWPLEAIKRLIDKPETDIQEIYTEYNIQRFLALPSVEEEEEEEEEEAF